VTKVVTYLQVVNALHAAVTDRGGDYVYEPVGSITACRNWHEETDEPGCIVGYVLHSLGAAKEQLAGQGLGGIQIEEPYSIAAGTTMAALECAGWTFKDRDKVLYLLSTVQSRQDRHVSWGEAVARGIEDTERAYSDRPA
jgi:hypothetical protein